MKGGERVVLLAQRYEFGESITRPKEKKTDENGSKEVRKKRASGEWRRRFSLVLQNK